MSGNPNHDKDGKFSSNATHGGGGKDTSVQDALSKNAALHLFGYDRAKAVVASAEKAMRDAKEAMDKIKGSEAGVLPGLTPDHIRAKPEWKAAKAASEKAFQTIRSTNEHISKNFANERKADRKFK